MRSLRLFTGNRLDLLAKALAKVLEAPLASPLEQEIIVIQSKGMERWISMQLAAHFGVWANGRFPFPNAFVYEIFQRVLPDLPDCSVFDPKFSTREVEILYDHLLEMFERDPNLLPNDILVMTPEIEIYAPFIQAVFDTPEDERRRVPYRIADRSMRKESQVVDAFLAMLDLWGERLTAPQVLGILGGPAVQAKFGLTDTDLDLIGHWVREVRMLFAEDPNGAAKVSAGTGLDRYRDQSVRCSRNGGLRAAKGGKFAPRTVARGPNDAFCKAFV